VAEPAGRKFGETQGEEEEARDDARTYAMELAVGGGMRRSASHTSLSESDDFELTRLLSKPRINVERQRSFDDRSLSDVSHSGGYGRGGFDGMYSPGGGLRSLVGTPASSALHSFEPHPIVGDAWEALRRSLVFFRGQPLGTVAAVDHASEEVLNYDQVGCHSILIL
jgi:hypothetical protein